MSAAEGLFRGRQHGVVALYIYGCRCAPCRAAATEYQRAVRAGLTRRVDATPFREWLNGPRCPAVAHFAELAGVSRRTLHRIKSGHQRTVKQSTADRLCIYLGWYLETVA